MKKILLSGEWTLSNGTHTVVGRVPGDVTNDLYLADVVKNPYYGENYKDSLWITREGWTYERTFNLSAMPQTGEKAYLYFQGIDTYADVYLNGKFVGSAESMHVAYRFNVNKALQKGENVVQVRMKNIYDCIGAEEQTKYSSIFCANRIYARKAQCHFGWDWAPKFPGYGIYRDVELVIESEQALENVGVSASITGEITFRATFQTKFTGMLEVSVSLEGTELVRERVAVNDSRRKLVNLVVENPKLWWPNGYGEQPLYEYRLTQIKEGVAVHEQTGTFGFRSIAIKREILDGENLGWKFQINGKEIFCRGSNWVPAECMTGSLNQEKYYEYILSAKQANMNMLRVWGGGIYESDVFYEYCDRMGIMVWQEFMFACSDIVEDEMPMVQKITDEAIYQVTRLRNHPCLTAWCGANEVCGAFDGREEKYSVFTTHYLLRGITKELCPEIPYERTSPFAFGSMQNDVCEGDCHNNLSEPCLFDASFKGFDNFEYDEQADWKALKYRIKNYERYVSPTKSNFSSECAVLGMCNYESLVKFTPQEELFCQSKFLEERFLGNPYTFVMPTFFERQKKLAEGMYGPLKDIKDLVKKANKAQLDIMKTEIVYCRANGRSHGFLSWMYNDIWPTGTWSVVDYYLSKKPAYYEMKRCFAPIMAQIIRVDDDYYLCYANDTDTPLELCTQIDSCDYQGNKIASYPLSLSVAGNTSGMEKLCIQLEKRDYICADGTFGEERFTVSYDLGRYREEERTASYRANVIDLGKNRYRVEIEAETFVPCVRIYAGERAYIQDNYFDMVAGEKKSVEVVIAQEGASVVCTTLFDDWNE